MCAIKKAAPAGRPGNRFGAQRVQAVDPLPPDFERDVDPVDELEVLLRPAADLRAVLVLRLDDDLVPEADLAVLPDLVVDFFALVCRVPLALFLAVLLDLPALLCRLVLDLPVVVDLAFAVVPAFAVPPDLEPDLPAELLADLDADLAPVEPLVDLDVDLVFAVP